MPNEMTPLEAAEKLEELICMMKDGYRPPFFCGENAALLPYIASLLRQIAAGELRPVIHAHPVMKHRHIGGYKYANCTECGTEIEIEHPAECDIPYCSNCGAELAESFQNVCPRCGALMDESDMRQTQGGKDDSHAD